MEDTTDTTEGAEPKPEKRPSVIVVKLDVPVQFGKDAPLIEELTIKPTARAFKEFSLPMKEDGTILYQPYALAHVGMKMAGHPAAVVDKLSVYDMNAIAQAVMRFLI